MWDYLQDSTVAAGADESEAGSPVLRADLEFALEQLPATGRLIDLGCGPGRAAIPFARRGWSVVGVDLSESMLAACGRNAEAAGVSIERLRANIVDLDCIESESFDAAICLFSTLGMVAGARNRRRVMEHAARLLRPGGTLILHGHNRGQHWRTAGGRRWLCRDLVRRMARSEEAGDWSMAHAPGRVGWTMHLFARRELTALATDAGLRITGVRPIGFGPTGSLSYPRWLPAWRAHGFLVAARRPD